VKISVLHGPNLKLLGKRELEIYGELTLKQLNKQMEEHVRSYNRECLKVGKGISKPLKIMFFQSDYEGELIEWLHGSGIGKLKDDGIIFNPAAYTHYSYALRDAIAAIETPVVEVHLSNPDAREEFRKINVVRDVCVTHFQGKGVQSYIDAIDYLIEGR
jgi:3-dehydroquinate dehydratase-2